MRLKKVMLLQTSTLRVVPLSFHSVVRDAKENREKNNGCTNSWGEKHAKRSLLSCGLVPRISYGHFSSQFIYVLAQKTKRKRDYSQSNKLEQQSAGQEARERISPFVRVSSPGFHAAIFFPRGLFTFSLNKLSKRGTTRSLTNYDKTCQDKPNQQT